MSSHVDRGGAKGCTLCRLMLTGGSQGTRTVSFHVDSGGAKGRAQCRSMLTVGAKGRDIYCSVPIPHAWCVNRSSQFVNAELEIFETEGRSEILDKQLCVCVTQHQHPPKTAHC